MPAFPNRRILVIDDEPSIHQDYCSILGAARDDSALADLEARIFDTPAPAAPSRAGFSLVSAHQGQEAVQIAREALRHDEPFCVAFVDMRMPPGWDGLRTVEELWKADPRLQVVMCTAYSDHSWSDVLDRLEAHDRLLVVKKPFEPIEVCQAAATLTAKWNGERNAEARIHALERLVAEATAQAAAAQRGAGAE